MKKQAQSQPIRNRGSFMVVVEGSQIQIIEKQKGGNGAYVNATMPIALPRNCIDTPMDLTNKNCYKFICKKHASRSTY